MSHTLNSSALTSTTIAASPVTSGPAKASELARHAADQQFGQVLARSLSTALHKARREQASADNKNPEARRMDGCRADANRTPQAASAQESGQPARPERAGKPDKAREKTSESPSDEVASKLYLDAATASSAAVSADGKGEVTAQSAENNAGASVQASKTEHEIQGHTAPNQTRQAHPAPDLPASPAAKDLTALSAAAAPPRTASAPLAACLPSSAVPSFASASASTSAPAPASANASNAAHPVQAKHAGKAVASIPSSALASMAAARSTSESLSQTAAGPEVADKSGSDTSAGADASVFGTSLNAASARSEGAGANALGDSLARPGATTGTQPSGPAWAQLEPEVGSPAWHQALSQQVMSMRAGDVSEAELQLNPAGLGPLRIKLSLRDQQLDAEFSAGHAQVRAALEAALPQLREALQQGGMQLGQAWVEPPNAQAATQENMGNMENMGNKSQGGREATSQRAPDRSLKHRESEPLSLAGRAGLSDRGPGQRLNTFA